VGFLNSDAHLDTADAAHQLVVFEKQRARSSSRVLLTYTYTWCTATGQARCRPSFHHLLVLLVEEELSYPAHLHTLLT
jgi:hypothetical protein